MQQKSNMRNQLTQILHRLIENDYDFQIIQNLKNIENRAVWKKMNIAPDIEIQLARNVNKYHRIMKMQRKKSRSSMSSWHSLKFSFFFQMIQFKMRSWFNFQKNTRIENENENENDIYQNRKKKSDEKIENEKLKYDENVILSAKSK